MNNYMYIYNMLSSSLYLPKIDMVQLQGVIEYLCKAEQITKHIYNLVFEQKDEKYKNYVVIKIKQE